MFWILSDITRNFPDNENDFLNRRYPLPRRPQNTYFKANCTILAPPELLDVALAAAQPVALALAAEQRILPNVFGLLRNIPGFPGRRLFVTLNASARTSTRWLSPTANCRDTASLQSQ